MRLRTLIRRTGLVLACTTTLVCAAGELVTPAPPKDAQLARGPMAATPVGDVALDSLRGGFDDGQGFRVSFGIERSTAINGTLVSVQSVQVADLSRITTDQARQLATVLGGAGVVRNGAGNSFQAAVGLPGATIIQNTLDNQTIKNATVINTSSTSLRLLQGINAGASLRDALIAPLVSRP